MLQSAYLSLNRSIGVVLWVRNKKNTIVKCAFFIAIVKCCKIRGTQNPTGSSETDRTLIFVKILREAPESHMTC